MAAREGKAAKGKVEKKPGKRSPSSNEVDPLVDPRMLPAVLPPSWDENEVRNDSWRKQVAGAGAGGGASKAAAAAAAAAAAGEFEDSVPLFNAMQGLHGWKRPSQLLDVPTPPIVFAMQLAQAVAHRDPATGIEERYLEPLLPSEDAASAPEKPSYRTWFDVIPSERQPVSVAWAPIDCEDVTTPAVLDEPSVSLPLAEEEALVLRKMAADEAKRTKTADKGKKGGAGGDKGVSGANGAASGRKNGPTAAGATGKPAVAVGAAAANPGASKDGTAAVRDADMVSARSMKTSKTVKSLRTLEATHSNSVSLLSGGVNISNTGSAIAATGTGAAGRAPLGRRSAFSSQVSSSDVYLQQAWLLSTFDLVASMRNQLSAGSFLYELIYPKACEGSLFPVYNPAGKYIVKLFHHGSWRRVTIDDRLPMLREYLPLLAQSEHAYELWAPLLAKALTKLTNGATIGRVYPPLMHMLTSWLPQTIRIAPIPDSSLHERITELCAIQTHDRVRIALACDQGVLSSVNNTLRIRPAQMYRVLDSKTVGDALLVLVASPDGTLDSHACAEAGSSAQQAWISVQVLRQHWQYLLLFHDPGQFLHRAAISDWWTEHSVPFQGSTPYLLALTCDEATDVFLCLSAALELAGGAAAEASVTVAPFRQDCIDQPSLLHLRTESVAADVLRVPAGTHHLLVTPRSARGYSLVAHSVVPLDLTPLETAIPKHLPSLHVRDVDGTAPAAPQPGWTILARYTLAVVKPTSLTTMLHLRTTRASPARLQLIDNATGQAVVPVTLRRTPPVTLTPSNHAYTLVLDARSVQPEPALPWKLRLIADQEDFVLEEAPLRQVADLDGELPASTSIATASKGSDADAVLFRHTMRGKEAGAVAMQLTAPPGVMLCLRAWHNGRLLHERSGFACVTLPLVNVPGPKPKDERTRAVSEESPRDAPVIIQGSLIASDSLLPPATAAGADASATAANPAAATLPAAGAAATSTSPAPAADPAEAPAAPRWALRCWSGSVLDIRRDTTREDELAAIKAEWEARQPGRAAAARAVREAWVGGGTTSRSSTPGAAGVSDAPPVEPMVKVASGEPIVVSDSVLATLSSASAARVAEFQAAHQRLLRQRAAYRDARAALLDSLNRDAAAWHSELQKARAAAAQERAAYIEQRTANAEGVAEAKAGSGDGRDCGTTSGHFSSTASTAVLPSANGTAGKKNAKATPQGKKDKQGAGAAAASKAGKKTPGVGARRRA